MQYKLPRSIKRQNFGHSSRGLTMLGADPSADYLKNMFPNFDEAMKRDLLEELKNEKAKGLSENDEGMIEQSLDTKSKE
jgi:hypothetical protein